MNDLKLDVEKLTVDLATLDGCRRQTAFFIPVPDGVTSPSAALAGELDDPTIDFLPCRIDHRTHLIRTEWIAYVEVASEVPGWRALEEVGAVAEDVELDLVTGESLSGTLMVEGSANTCRVSDYLNRLAGRFVLVRRDAATLFINRRAIAQVRFEEPR